ncbi:MAG: hypothetical protein ACRCT1_07395 [Microcoleaceae cyanobacterium]
MKIPNDKRFTTSIPLPGSLYSGSILLDGTFQKATEIKNDNPESILCIHLSLNLWIVLKSPTFLPDYKGAIKEYQPKPLINPQ